MSIDYSALVFTVNGLYEDDNVQKILYGFEITVSNPAFNMGKFSVTNIIELENTSKQVENAIKKGNSAIFFSTDSPSDFWIKYSDTKITFGTCFDSGTCSFMFPVNESCKQMLVSLQKMLENANKR
jgi:hypothetical protein